MPQKCRVRFEWKQVPHTATEIVLDPSVKTRNGWVCALRCDCGYAMNIGNVGAVDRRAEEDVLEEAHNHFEDMYRVFRRF